MQNVKENDCDLFHLLHFQALKHWAKNWVRFMSNTGVSVGKITLYRGDGINYESTKRKKYLIVFKIDNIDIPSETPAEETDKAKWHAIGKVKSHFWTDFCQAKLFTGFEEVYKTSPMEKPFSPVLDQREYEEYIKELLKILRAEWNFKFDTSLVSLPDYCPWLRNLTGEHWLLYEKTTTKNEVVETKERKLTPDQQAKIECRKIAKLLWREKPNLTIADVTRNEEVLNASSKNCGTSYYLEKTVRDWIKDLCPNRKGGRRPKRLL